MPNKLSLLQVSPPSNPDTNITSVVVSGAYVNGTADPLPLDAIADPGGIGQVPMPNYKKNGPLVDPQIFGFASGYYAQVQKANDGSFGLRWFSSQGAELGSGNFPAGITGGRLFLRILVNLPTQG